jgi:hypothetical protein
MINVLCGVKQALVLLERRSQLAQPPIDLAANRREQVGVHLYIPVRPPELS